ncbi:RDD family protein [Mucilaginibacter koreensis]
MDTIRITTSQNIDIDYELAGLGERMVARIIDMGLFFVILIASLIIIGLKADNRGSNDEPYLIIGILAVVYGLLFVFYDLLCEIFMHGQSIGKRIMKIKVISLEGKQPTIGQYLLRWLFRIVDFSLTAQLGGLIAVAVSERKQRIGDMVAGTTLIKTNPRTQMNQISFMPDEGLVYEPVFKEAVQLSEKNVALIQDVINTYVKTQNSMLVYNMALRIKEHLGVTPPAGMNDMKFLQTIIKDYGYLVSAQEGMV